MLHIKTLANLLKSKSNISIEEIIVALPMILAELNSIRNSAVMLVDSIDNLKYIIEEVIDEDHTFDKSGDIE
jgi:hypothetical protein